jgi:long-chain acyl-CoA synthetase
MLPNMLAYPVAFLGTLRAGLIAVNVNPLYTPRELKEQLADSGAEVIVIMENFAHKLETAIAETKIRHVVVARLGDFVPTLKRWAFNFANSYIQHAVPAWTFDTFTMMQDACVREPGARYSDAKTPANSVALLQYTGGTTGVPKGAMLTHANLVANLQQAHAWLKPFMTAAQETILTALPLYHIFALTVSLVFFKIGGNNVLVADPRNIPGLIGEMRRHRISVLIGVNTLFNAMMNNARFAKLDFSSLWLCLGGGMATQRAVAERWQKVTGRPLIEAYGLTRRPPH